MIVTLGNDLERDADNPKRLLQHLRCLRECGEDKSVKEMVKNKLHAISLPGVALTPSDIHAIGKVATYCDELEIMQLINCQLNRRLIEILVAVMSDSEVKVRSVRITVISCFITCDTLNRSLCLTPASTAT